MYILNNFFRSETVELVENSVPLFVPIFPNTQPFEICKGFPL